ncbi:PIN domain-containing protein [Kitasatospora sp. NPDC054768]|uniref:PIN domain-containing protein n=1 Tax=Kitasatospora sp. NBC_01519 TaxID=2903576 RepID=UPI002F909BCC
MIIFDTNAINRINPRSPRADIVRALRASGQHRVGIPGTVLEELAAHKAKDYVAQRETAASALNALQRMMPWKPTPTFEEPPLELEECQEYWRKVYSELFEVVPTSGEAALKALSREALALPPAKQGEKRAEGARDAAIWFTILEFLRNYPDEDVHFVTDNTTDFGDGTVYRFPMDQDLGDLAGRLKRLKDFDAVVTAFTVAVDNASAAADAKRFLDSEPVAATIGGLAFASHRAVLGLPGITTTGAPIEWNAWITPPRSTLLSSGKAAGHRIGKEVWYTAETTWLLYGLAAAVGQGLEGVSCIWTVKLLFSADADGDQGAPTLLSPDDPSAPDLQDKPTTDALAALHKEALRELISKRKPDSATTADQAGRPTGPSDVGLLYNYAPGLADAVRAAVLPTFDFASWSTNFNYTAPVADAVKAAALSRTNLSALLASATEAADLVSGLPNYSGLLSPTNPSMYVRTWPHDDIDALEELSGSQEPERPNEDDS